MSGNLNRKEKQDALDNSVKDVSLFSGRISELCKFVWAGALAIFYALVTSDPTSTATKFIGTQRPLLFVAAIAGSLAFLFDYLQNISAYIFERRYTNWIKSQDVISIAKNNKRTNDGWSKANSFFFVLKNVAVLITAALVAYVIIAGFLK
jgi:hypothetical protein